MSGVPRRAAFGVLGVLGLLVAITVPSLGSDPWPFRAPVAAAHGLLGPLVRAADGKLLAHGTTTCLILTSP